MLRNRRRLRHRTIREADVTGGNMKANLLQPTLTPDQHDRLVSVARNFDAERITIANQYRPLLRALNGQTPQDQSLKASSVAQLGMPPRYLAMVKAPDTGLGAAFPAFTTFAWANYAPNVERLPLGLTEEFTLYLEHFIALDPGTGKIWASSTAHLDSGAPGYYGNQVSLNQTLYHAPGGDEWQFQSDTGPAFASAFLMVQPGHIGDFYRCDADAWATVYNLDDTSSATANTSVFVLASSCQPVIRDDGGGFTVDGVPTNGFVAGPGSGRSGSITIYGQCMDDVTQITFSGLLGLTATRSGAPAPVAGSPIPGLQTLSTSYQASDAGLSADPAAAMWGYMVVNTVDGRQSAHPAVLAKRLPAITSVIPYPWQSGSVVPYTIYGAGFGANPAVSIVLDNQATVGQPVVTKCVPIACSDNFIEGTVALLPEVVPDWATVTVGYAGYLSFVPQAPPAGGQGAARVPVVPAPGTASPTTVDGLQLLLPPTPNAVDIFMPAVTPVLTTNRASAFATNSTPDLIVVLKDSGTLTLTAANIQPASDTGRLRWQLDRDSADTVDTGSPSFDGTAVGAQVSFQPAKAGNFRVVAYIDLNNSGAFDEGEQVGILRLAVIRVSLMPSSRFQLRNTLMATGASAVVTSLSSAPMALFSPYLLEGGGASRTVGTGKIIIGNIGNLIGDTFTVGYPALAGAAPRKTNQVEAQKRQGARCPW
jgi:hypothetical protein